MAMLTIRKLPDEIHRALVLRAEKNGKSMEAEARDILEDALRGTKRVSLVEVLADIGRDVGLTDDDLKVFDQIRDNSPARTLEFD